jgi:Uma2 family endonuclease
MQTFADEITLPETKPETEWIDGRAVQKVMPTREHGILQKAFLYALDAWANSTPNRAGNVVAEWRFRISIPGTRVHPLVPDVTYMSFKRLRSLSKKDRSTPSVPPEIVVEVLSPDDKPKDVKAKRKEYLAWGVSLVLIVDYETRSMEAYDATGYHGSIGNVEDYVPPMFPDLHLPLQRMFAELDLPEPDFDTPEELM